MDYRILKSKEDKEIRLDRSELMYIVFIPIKNKNKISNILSEKEKERFIL